MPNRIIREGICTSDTINELEPAEEVFFYRLLVVADDYGRFDGRLAILKSECFPLRDVKPAALESWLKALERVGLIVRYQVDGKPYLLICKWSEHQRLRNVRSKYPAPVEGEPVPPVANPPSIDRDPPPTAADGGSRAPAHAAAESESESESESEINTEEIPAAAWRKWERHHGGKISPDRATLQIGKLKRLMAQGHDPRQLVDLAIESNWPTFYPPKAQSPPKAGRAQSLAERRTGTVDAITGANPNGRAIESTATRVDSPAVHALPERVREPGGHDVGNGGTS